MAKDDFGWIIVSIAIVATALIYACSTRYTYVSKPPSVLDRWTGRVRSIGNERFDIDAYIGKPLQQGAISPSPSTSPAQGSTPPR